MIDPNNEKKEIDRGDTDNKNKKSCSDENVSEEEQSRDSDSSMPQMQTSTDDENNEGGSRSKGQSAIWSRRDGKTDIDPYNNSNSRNAFDPRIPNTDDSNKQKKQQKTDINFDGRNETDEDKNGKKHLHAKGSDDDGGLTEQNNQSAITVKGIERLMRGISGKIQYCKHAQKERANGGSPRQTKLSKSLVDILDSHPLDRYLWINNLSPRLPRSFERISRKRSGSIVMIRDISGSMVGLPALWSSAVAQNVIQVAKKNRMNIGYCEFNEKAYLYKKYDASVHANYNANKTYRTQSYRNDETFDHEDGIFFTKDYQNVHKWAKQIRSEGTTNYSSPLSLVLDEFENQMNWYDRPNSYNIYGGSGGNFNSNINNSHIVLLTDGVPTEGDLKCEQEKKRATELGVSIHTIFVDTVWAFDVRRMSKRNNKKQGSTYPIVLDELALLTQGLQYRASLDSNGAIDVLKHESGSDRWSEIISEARARGMDRVGVMAGYGSQSPGYVTHPVVKNFK